MYVNCVRNLNCLKDAESHRKVVKVMGVLNANFEKTRLPKSCFVGVDIFLVYLFCHFL